MEYHTPTFNSSVNWNRKENIDQMCKSKKIVSSIQHNSLFVLKDRKVVWCIVPKAGTSLWLNNLFEMSSMPEVSINGIECSCDPNESPYVLIF